MTYFIVKTTKKKTATINVYKKKPGLRRQFYFMNPNFQMYRCEKQRNTKIYSLNDRFYSN